MQMTELGFSRYAISSLGRLINLKTNYISNGTNHRGYIVFCPTDDSGHERRRYAHILVAHMFIGINNDPNLTVDHIDRNRANNRVENLRYATKSEQKKNRVMKEPVCRRIGQYDLSGNLIKVWNSVRRISEELKLPYGSVYSACDRKSSYIGFYWRSYAEQCPADEKWVLIPYPELQPLYVSQYGRTMRTYGRISNGILSIAGYMTITVKYKDSNDRANLPIHRLVMAAFHGRNDDLVVNHKDGNKTNNNLENLEYVNQHQNLIHATEMGLIKTYKIGQYDMEGNLIATYNGHPQAARAVGRSASSIYSACKGVTKTSAGFKWKYLDN